MFNESTPGWERLKISTLHQYWKTVLLTSNGFHGPNKEMRFVQGPMYIAIDDRYDHATVLRALTPETVGIWFAIQNPNIYSLGGFQKLCK